MDFSCKSDKIKLEAKAQTEVKFKIIYRTDFLL